MLVLVLGADPVQAQQGEMPALASQSVNINSDNASVLADGLTGVGLSRAEDIIRYREEFGPFTTVEQLSEVKGIGKATLDKNRARITLD
ncbi:competence protein ComEA [Pseudohalioglobus lutimaris]|uniref:Competence protein ComEA n=2 Tax=Pseudohalioglobus lutimaris TaxID=1737061 RepID=A0A2N5X5N0_9GAMM|nr:competence protein ComEA [Pseudohalioglobus lutimaris]